MDRLHLKATARKCLSREDGRDKPSSAHRRQLSKARATLVARRDADCVFFHRTGKWQIWAIKPDGSGLEQLTNAAGGADGPVWSPDGTRLFCFSQGGQPFVVGADKPSSERTYRELQPESESGGNIWAWSWSADGSRLVGPLLR